MTIPCAWGWLLDELFNVEGNKNAASQEKP